MTTDAVDTGVERETPAAIGRKLIEAPEGFNLHPTIEKRFLAARAKPVESGEGIDWATAESSPSAPCSPRARRAPLRPGRAAAAPSASATACSTTPRRASATSRSTP
jgi:2-oxoglutarate dehydrogenase complex dehydrogenase (E1) component-like enzyme